jgi:mono/diheme cytochrome c family protein
MKALKTGLVIAVSVLFYIACSSPQTTNQNVNQPANTNVAPTTSTTPAADASQANTNASTQTKADPVPGVNAAALFEEQKCALCHGVDGKGKAKGAPDFTKAEWQNKESNDELIEQIKDGEPPKMPAYKDKLSDVQIKALVAHIRSFAK